MANRRINAAMPRCTHKQDREFINSCLLAFGATARVKVCALYDSAYKETWRAHKVKHQRQNRARFSANTRLRLYVAKYAKAAQGFSSAPPKAENNQKTLAIKI